MDPSALGSILIDVIFPIVLVAGAGFTVARALDIESRSLSRLMLYLFTPALVFSASYHTRLSAEYISIALYALIITAVMGVVAWAEIKFMRYDRLTASGFALAVVFSNAGNYGLPLILFAFGPEGLARGALYFTVSAILTQTVAIFIAARGRADARAAVLNVFKMPLIYAVSLGLLFNLARVTVPDPLLKAIDPVADAAVPVMLAILGIELARVTIDNDRLTISLATFTKLVLTPLAAFALAAVMGLQGVARSVCILEASMPTAVISSIIAVEFDARPKLVTGIVFATTLFSIVTLTVLLAVLR